MALTDQIALLATRAATEDKSLRTLLNGNAADLSALDTTATGNLVAAINELWARPYVTFANSEYRLFNPVGSTSTFLGGQKQTTSFAGLVTTTLTAGVDVFNQDFSFPTDGDYMIKVSGWYNCDVNSSDGIINLAFNGSDFNALTPSIARAEFKDNAGNLPVGSASAQVVAFQAVDVKTVTAGNINMQMTVLTEVAGVEASVWGVTVDIQKIAD